MTAIDPEAQPGQTAPMLIYKILRSAEWAQFQANGVTDGAPVDLTDGFIHFSTASQLAMTLAKYFANQNELFLLACDGDQMGDALRWEVSRGGEDFPHLYRQLWISEVLWTRPVSLGPDGRHITGNLE